MSFLKEHNYSFIYLKLNFSFIMNLHKVISILLSALFTILKAYFIVEQAKF